MKQRSTASAFTLPELVVSMAVGVSMLAGLLIGSTTLQRGYMAAQYQLDCQQDQVRILDYLTRDVRRALAVTTSNQGRQLNLTLPDQLDQANLGGLDPRAALRMPQIVGGTVQYGTTPIAVSYYVCGNAFMRNENGTETVLSTNRFGVEGFLVSPDNVSGASAQLSLQLSFVPRFSAAAGSAQRVATQLGAAIRLRNGAQIVTQ